MNRFAKVYAILTALLLIGIGGAVIAATVEIETIVGTGPIFSIVGLGLCLVWFFHRRGLWAPLVALSLPAVSLAVFWLIYSRGWSPHQASKPVSAILLVYQVATVVIGLIGIREQLSLSRQRAKRGVQFSIKSLLGLTAITAVALGAVRLALEQGAHGGLGLAIGFTVLTLCGIVATVVWPQPPVEGAIVEADSISKRDSLKEVEIGHDAAEQQELPSLKPRSGGID